MVLRLTILCVLLLWVVIAVSAQDEQPSPQFLLREDNQLILVNGYTGDTTDIPIDLSDRDTVKWSPDGTYLEIGFYQEETYRTCINLYNFDAQEWVSPTPIACEVKDTLLTADDSQFIYVTDDRQNAQLWLFDIETELESRLFETIGGDEVYNMSLSSLRFSPSGKYLLFTEYESIMGGSRNSLIVMNVTSHKYITVQAPRLYYASYSPIWSPNDNWFLIMLKEEYVVSGTIPDTNHEGDVYLVNIESGEQLRLTYTPAVQERDIHWTDDGQIAFTEVVMNNITLTIDEAQNIAPVPFEDIIQPEEYEWESVWFNSSSYIQSPDPSISAWHGLETNDGEYTYTLSIGEYLEDDIVFTLFSPDDLQNSDAVIGWRPTAFVYPQG